MDFTTPTQFDATNSTGVWNPFNARLEAGIAPLAPSGSPLNFGDGSDGDFADGNGVPVPRNGLTIVGTNITANTDIKAEYSFRSFNLSASYVLLAIGSKPLTIRVYGPTTIAGTINSNGHAGADNGATGAGNQVVGPIAGGTAGAGGGSGGQGGQIDGAGNGTPGSSGNAPGTSSHGGGVGSNVNQVFQDRAGGGGCNDVGALAGQNAGGSAGVCSAASVLATSFETTFWGGGGGGGGGACTTGGSCDGIVGGGAGGGSGGAIRIVSLQSISLSGTITAKGGDGGRNNADNGGLNDCGGGGGGGSGGSVWLQSASDVQNPGGGSIDISKGLGGVAQGTCNSAGYDGGDGSSGVFRVDAASNAFGAASLSKQTGIIQGTEFVIVSKALDFSKNSYDFTSAKETLGCGSTGSLKVIYEGSSDGTTFTKSVAASEISQLNAMPYLRFKVTILPTGANPPCLTALSIDYQAALMKDFTLRGSPIMCGTISRSRSHRSTTERPLLLAMLGDLSVLALTFLTARKISSLI